MERADSLVLDDDDDEYDLEEEEKDFVDPEKVIGSIPSFEYGAVKECSICSDELKIGS